MAKAKKGPGPMVATADQCGVRCFWRDSPRHKPVHSMTCTLPLGHEKNVHEEYRDGVFMGGWVDRAPDPFGTVQQFPRATPSESPAGGDAP